jgi:hypothetical protein
MFHDMAVYPYQHFESRLKVHFCKIGKTHKGDKNRISGKRQLGKSVLAQGFIDAAISHELASIKHMCQTSAWLVR